VALLLLKSKERVKVGFLTSKTINLSHIPYLLLPPKRQFVKLSCVDSKVL